MAVGGRCVEEAQNSGYPRAVAHCKRPRIFTMSESIGASFPSSWSEEIRNLPGMEIVTGSKEITPANLTLAITDPDEELVRQSVVPLLGDSRADQSTLIGELICEELRRAGAWITGSRHSEREVTGSSPSSQEDFHLVRSLSCPRSMRYHSTSPSSCSGTRSRSPSRH